MNTPLLYFENSKLFWKYASVKNSFWDKNNSNHWQAVLGAKPHLVNNFCVQEIAAKNPKQQTTLNQQTTLR